MKYFIFRNYTIEPFFRNFEAKFSGYEDISFVDEMAERYVWWYFAPYRADNEIIAREIECYGNLLLLILQKINPNKMVLVFTIKQIFKNNIQTTKNHVNKAIINYNQNIHDLAKKHKNFKIIDFNDCVNCLSSENLIDWKFYFLSQMPFNPKFANKFSAWFARQLEIIELKRKKCIVLDLDNTLWGGILGEDGAKGIKIGETYPGNCFLFFQEYLLQLHKAGIILTVCSKNNEKDVTDLWYNHPNLKIRQEQLSAWRINWNNKADNICEIATELNIGLDSLVFVDDNPSERVLVSQMLPQVAVPAFPKQPYLFPEFCKSLTNNYFAVYELTSEDLTKTQQYKENAKRKRFESRFIDFNFYLKSLEIELTIESLDNINIVRFVQMTQKTNQFNLTTHRYTEGDLRELVNNGAMIYGLRVKDRFGDNGLTGMIIITNKIRSDASRLKITDKNVEIDTFLLSCRILGKNIETEFLKYILLKLKKVDFKMITAKYIKTQKNVQVENFYEKLDFNVVKQNKDEKEYELNLLKTNYLLSDIYNIVEK
jgi:FkbH-like protein